MRYFDWNLEKEAWLKEERSVSFEEVIEAFNNNRLLEVAMHPNQKRYPGQYILYVEIRNYAYMVPCVIDDEKVFFKTIIPSRKATQKYL